MKQFAVIIFPGTNCDRDVVQALSLFENCEVTTIWHVDTAHQDLRDFDALILPGGFSYGDVLRAGAIASFSPIVKDIQEYARQESGLILGICNGFQILTEAGLLPGALRFNQRPRFLCRHQPLQVVSNETPFTQCYQKNEVVDFPIAHAQGNYYASKEILQKLKQRGQILFRYQEDNPNGSVENIAGILSQNKRILGLMPHPERNTLPMLGDGSGKKLFQSMLEYSK